MLLKTPFRLLTVAIVSALPFSTFADSWSCKHDNHERVIEIQRSTDAPVPCEVVYKKVTEGAADQVLWNANAEAGYCEDKAAAFVAKQEGWGWTCTQTSTTEAPAADAPADAPAEAPATEEAPMTQETAPAATQ